MRGVRGVRGLRRLRFFEGVRYLKSLKGVMINRMSLQTSRRASLISFAFRASSIDRAMRSVASVSQRSRRARIAASRQRLPEGEEGPH